MAFSQVTVFGCRAHSKKRVYFWVYKVQIHVHLFSTHYFNYAIVKTEIKKNGLNLINLGVSKALKRQLSATQLGISLIECDVF